MVGLVDYEPCVYGTCTWENCIEMLRVRKKKLKKELGDEEGGGEGGGNKY